MFQGFTAQTIGTGNGVEIAAWIGGSGPPLLLLHGFPQTHVCWRKVVPFLTARFTVVATDLRGYGASSKPPGDPLHESYSKRAMAADQVEVMRRLGFDRFRLVGHDRGGRVAHRLALDHPEAVDSLAVLDISPTATMYARTDRAFAEAYYHWFFLIQPHDLPELMIGADPEYFMRHTLASWCKTPGAMDEEAVASYIEAFAKTDAIHAACEDYRAAASIDLEHDAADEKAGRRLSMPLLALWGARGTIGRQFDVLETWREKTNASVTGKALDCGHFLPEEAPHECANELLEFL